MPKHLLRKFFLSLVAAATISAGIILSSTTQATTTFFYSVTELGSLGGNQSVAYDINNSGQVVGYSSLSGGPGSTHAVLWNKDTLIDLRQSGPYPLNWASAINEAGQVICNIDPGSHTLGRCPYLWQSGNLTYIGECGGSGYVNAINKAGQVAGFDLGKAFEWQSGYTYHLISLNGNYAGDALGINDKGQVVGYSPTSSNQQHAVLWQNGRVIDLGTLSSGSNSQASSINNAGKVVGWSNTSSGAQHAVLWQNRKITDLGTFDGNDTQATDINTRGTVVGYSFTRSSYANVPVHAFVWRNGVMKDLNSLLPDNSGWELNAANAINDRGQIVGSGQKDGQTKAFLLTPVLLTK